MSKDVSKFLYRKAMRLTLMSFLLVLGLAAPICKAQPRAPQNDMWATAQVITNDRGSVSANNYFATDEVDYLLWEGSFDYLWSFAYAISEPAYYFQGQYVFLRDKLPADTLAQLVNYVDYETNTVGLSQILATNLNDLILGECIYDTNYFADVYLRPETQALLDLDPPAQGQDLVRLNRLLMEDAFQWGISRNHGIEFENASVWYSWTPTQDGVVTFNITNAVGGGTNLNTVLAVCTGTDYRNAVIGYYNDDFPLRQNLLTNVSSRVTFEAVGGMTYHILVDTHTNEFGTFTLDWYPQEFPANDMFSRAKRIYDTQGSIAGSNVCATAREWEDYNGPRNASVWYVWTAPVTATISFNISATSSDIDPALPLDTYMAVYTIPPFAGQEILFSNDDYAGNQNPVSSKVTFTAVAGATYYISIDSRNDTGTFTLEWSALEFTRSSGIFRFASSRRGSFAAYPLYLVGDWDEYTEAQYQFDPYNFDYKAFIKPHMTVTRTGGSSGRVLVDYTIAPASYTNVYSTNVYLTNIYTIVSGKTNVSITGAVYVSHDVQHNVRGTLTHVLTSETVSVKTNWDGILTNFTGISLIGSDITNQVAVTETATGGTMPAPSDLGQVILASGTGTNDAGEITYTNVYQSGWVVYQFEVPSAYSSETGTLVFDDFEMSREIYPRNPYSLGDLNSTILCSLSNPRLAPEESFDPFSPEVISDIAPPAVDPQNGRAAMNVLSLYGSPGTEKWPILNFERAVYNVSPSHGSITIWVYRTGAGDGCSVNYHVDWDDVAKKDWINSFSQEVGSDYAVRNEDFTPVGGTLSWGGDDYLPKSFTIPILTNNNVRFNRDIQVSLWKPNKDDKIYLGHIRTANITVEFNHDFGGPQPAGAVDRTYNPDNNNTNYTHWAYPESLSENQTPFPGANRPVYAVVVQDDGKAVIAGEFTSYNGHKFNHIARLLTNGWADVNGFLPGSGANDPIEALAITPNGKFIIGGSFTSFNGVSRYRVARLNADGSLDQSFTPGDGVRMSSGADARVEAIALQPDGKIIIAGTFDTYNKNECHNIARLNADGTFDPTFDATLGTRGSQTPDGESSGSIHALALEPGGSIVVGGSFAIAGGVPRSKLARFLPTGDVDPYFSVGGEGINGDVYALAVQLDGKILLGGAFTSINGVSQNHITRLLRANALLDTSFQVGVGADAPVWAVTIEPDGAILLGGEFTEINRTRRVGVARLLPYGPVDTTFMDTAYNQFAGLINHCSNPNAYNEVDAPADFNFRNVCYSIALDRTTQTIQTSQTNQETQVVTNIITLITQTNIMIGGSFERVGGGLSRNDVRFRRNVARLVGGATPGPGNIEFMNNYYSADERATFANIALTRTNGSLGAVSVSLVTNLFNGNGSIKSSELILSPENSEPMWPSLYSLNDILLYNGPNYPHRDYGWMVSDGLYGPNFATLPNDEYKYANVVLALGTATNKVVDGNRTAMLSLLQPSSADTFFLGGLNIPLGAALGRASATFEILDDDSDAGVFSFSSTDYAVNENVTSVTITVDRKNGSFGAASVDWEIFNGTNISAVFGGMTNVVIAGATNNIDFRSTYMKGKLTFGDTVVQKTFTVNIIGNYIAQPDRYFTVKLSNGSGLSKVDTNASVSTVTIIDDDFKPGHVDFVVTNFIVSELSTSAVVTVNRRGGSTGKLRVDCAVTAGSARSPNNFVATMQTLIWEDLTSGPRTMLVPIRSDDLVTSNLVANLVLFNPRVGLTNAPEVLAFGHGLPATLTILNQDFYGNYEFSSPTYNVMENAGTATLTIVRKNGSSGTNTIGYQTFDGTAVNTNDYFGTNSSVVFLPGEINKRISVNLVDDSIQNGNRALNVTLFDLGTNNVLAGVNGIVPITNAVVNIIDDETFSGLAGSVDKTFNIGSGFNGNVLSLAKQNDGKILAGGDFTLVNSESRNRIVRIDTNGTVDMTFRRFEGANDSVRAIVAQQPNPDSVNGAILLAGEFTTVNNVNQRHLTRLYEDGRLDDTFQVGSGADSPIYAIAETLTRVNTNFTRNIIIAGSFLNYDGVNRKGIARLNNNGSLDYSFDPGVGGGGDSSVIYALAIQADGKIIVAGDFTTFASEPRSHIARLNVDGSLDMTFEANVGDSVRALAIQPDGKILIGGLFTKVNEQSFNHIARLNNDGTLDTTFNVGLGCNDTVLALQVDPVGRILVGGEFTLASGVTRHKLTQLNADGTVDPGINFGSGADGFVSSIVVQNDGNLVVGGGFTTFDGTKTPGLVRLFGGSMIGYGKLQFEEATYRVNEDSSVATVTIRRKRGTFDTISADVLVGEGAMGGSFSHHVTFTQGETIRSFTVPILDNLVFDGDRTIEMTLTNLSPADIDGSRLESSLIVVDNECGVSFVEWPSVKENDVSKKATINLIRTGNTSLTASVDVITTFQGTARPGVRYRATNTTVYFAVGQTNATAYVDIINDNIFAGDQTLELILANPSGAIVVEPSTAILTIQEDEIALGDFTFELNEYTVNETEGSVTLTVIRTNGYSGFIQVTANTLNGTAINGLQYTGIPIDLAVDFADGVTRRTITVAIKRDPNSDGDKYFFVSLSNPTTGSQILSPTAKVTITEGDSGGNFGTVIISSGQAMTQESITPANGVIDLGETVTVWLGLRSVSGETTNLVATLVSTNGVVAPANGSTKTYGALKQNGHTVSMPFTFTASGTNGQLIKATLRLEDRLPNATNYSFSPVYFNFTITGTNISFSNPGGIVINDAVNTANGVMNGIASPYPSKIVVPYMPATIRGVTVTVLGVSHEYSRDINMLLVGPGGQKVVLMSHCGTSRNMSGVNLTFTEVAAGRISESALIGSGTYKPSAYASYNDTFIGSPSGPCGTNLNVFTGSNPSGDWRLFVVDDSPADSGLISNGWKLSFNYGSEIQENADLEVVVKPSSASTIVGNTFTYQVAVTNYGPGAASNVKLTQLIPKDAVLVPGTMVPSTVNGVLTWSLPNLPQPNIATGNNYGTSFDVSFVLNAVGVATNVVNITATQLDPYLKNNSIISLTSVENVPGAPSLNLVRTLDGVILTWTGIGYALFSTPSLAAPVVWAPVTNPVNELSDSQYSVPVTSTNSNRFYRLKKSVQ